MFIFYYPQVDIIKNNNRYIVALAAQPTRVSASIENVRQALQDRTNRIVLIENISKRRVIVDSILSVQKEQTDVTFVVVNHFKNAFTLYSNQEYTTM